MDQPALPDLAALVLETAEGRNAEITEFPAFNQFQAACAAFFEGSVEEAEVVDAMDTLDLVLGVTFQRFFEQLPFEEATPELAGIVRILDSSHGPLRECTIALRARLEEGEAAGIEAALAATRLHVHDLCDGLNRLRALQQKRAPVSESPWADELVRVARLYLSGRLPLSSFQQRFERFAAWHRDLETGIAMLQPAPQERSTVEQFRPRLDAALRSQGEAVAELALFFEDLVESRVEPALRQILDVAVLLVEAQRAIEAAGEKPPTIPCVRCGAENDATARHCRRCNAMLLRSAPDLEMTETQLDLMDSGQARGPRVIENVRRLEEATAEAGRGDATALLALVEELDARVAAGIEGLKRVQDPPPETPRDQMEIYRHARATLEEGGMAMQEGLHLLRQYLETREVSLLSVGLARYRAGAEPAVEVQVMWEQLQAGQGA